MLKPGFKAVKPCLVFDRECKAADVIVVGAVAADVEKAKRCNTEKSFHVIDQLGDGGFNFLLLVYLFHVGFLSTFSEAFIFASAMSSSRSLASLCFMSGLP